MSRDNYGWPITSASPATNPDVRAVWRADHINFAMRPGPSILQDRTRDNPGCACTECQWKRTGEAGVGVFGGNPLAYSPVRDGAE